MTTPAQGRHRAAARPRYGRLGLVLGSAAVTVLAVLAGVGVVPTEPDAVAEERPAGSLTGGPSTGSTTRPAPAVRLQPARSATALPAGSGEGRRVVFDRARQRVWLVSADGRVARTYPVSGSVTDNLDAGSYRVWSRSRNAVGIDDSGTMQYFVRFARGERAAIGFHDIPVDDGEFVQTTAELGTPRSHGCIRQRRSDARVLWRFAPLGTRVVVL